MKFAIVFIALLAYKSVFSQEWHSANKKLKPPKNSSGYNITVIFFDKYDTVPCIYVTADGREQKGYKSIFLRNGYYTDDANTFRVFFDDRMIRVYNVERYYLE